MKKIKIGICGLNRGRAYINPLIKNEKYELVAICDIDKAKADSIAKSINKQVKVYYDHKALCADNDVEVVVMATPIDAHAETVIDALSAGKHVISEVIVATSIEDIHRIAEAIKKSGKKYIMAENYCYIRPLLIAENMIKQGLLGEIYYAEGDYLKDFQAYHPNFPNIGGWRQPTYFGRKGHPYITHSIGPLLHIMKEKVVSVCALGAGNHFDMVADDTCVLMLKTEKGHLIRLRSSFVSPRPDNVTYYAFQGLSGCYQAPQGDRDFHKVYIPQFCRAGGWNNPAQWRNIYDFREFVPEAWKKYWKLEDYEGKNDNDTYELFDSGFEFMLDEFANCFLNGTEPPISFEDAANWTAAGILSEVSVNNGGRPVSIPTFQ